MKDIDFDELDRAVNSLMSATPNDQTADVAAASSVTSSGGDAPADNNATPNPAATQSQPESTDMKPASTVVLDLDAPVVASENDLTEVQQPDGGVAAESAVSPTPAPAPVTPAPAPSAPTPADATPVAPAARRGRFMDVVRPTIQEVHKPAPSKTASRQGATVQPPSAQADSQVTPVTENAQPSEAVVSAGADMTPAEQTPEVVDDTPPLNSPFLPGAKVEKRPLGRPNTSAGPVVDLAAELAADAPAATPTPVPETTAVDDSISPNKDAQIPEEPLPAELGSELLSIETNADNLPPEIPQPVVADAQGETPQVAPVEEPAPSVAPTPQQPTPEPARAAMVTSIPQQYKLQQPQQGADEAPVGAIYDAQPLAHSGEKKSGWVWKVVAIVAIILIGAGGGAAIYYLGLI